MPAGSFATFHATSSIDTPGTSYELFDPTYDEDSNIDGIVTEISGKFTINETGKYLVLYAINCDSISTAEGNLQSRLLNNDVPIPGSFASSHLRNKFNIPMTNRGQFIQDFNQNDVISIEWIIDDDPDADNLLDVTYVQFIRLTDESDTAYGLYTDGADTQSFAGTTFTDVPWDTTTLQSDISVIEKQAGNTAIRLKEIGRYLVCFSIPCIASQTFPPETQRIGRITLGVNVINASQCFTFGSDFDIRFGVLNCFVLIDNDTANQDLVIQMQRGNADDDGTVNRVINESGLFVMKLLDTTRIFISYDNSITGEQYNGASNVNYSAMRINGTVDTGFSSDTINSMELTANMNVIAWGNMFVLRTNESSGQINNRKAVILINSTEQVLGQNTVYAPGDFNFAFNSGNVAGALFVGGSNNDSFELQSQPAGSNGDITDKTIPNQVGFFALNVDTLSPPPPFVPTKTISSNLCVDNNVNSELCTDNNVDSELCVGIEIDSELCV